MAESKGQKSGRQNEYLNLKKKNFVLENFLIIVTKAGNSMNVIFF